MDADKVKMIFGMLVFFYIIVGIECIFLDPDPEPIYPQKMVKEITIKEDNDGNPIPDPDSKKTGNLYLHEERLVPKKYDPETDSFWEGMYLRDVVYFCMGIIMFLGSGGTGYFAFTGSVYWLASSNILPKDVPATETCVWGMFFGPLILMAYCVYAAYKTVRD